MRTHIFTSGRIRRAEYDPGSRQLELHWDGKKVLAYQQVPEEVFRRLCAAPNAAAYWEDRIADEYSKGLPKKSAGGADGARSFDDLFGNGAD